jgi:hypothetical protein
MIQNGFQNPEIVLQKGMAERFAKSVPMNRH